MVSERARDTTSFAVMDVLERANELEARGRDVVHLEVGEPEFEPPARVVDAAVDSLRAGETGYTATRGKPPLLRAIADYYDRTYGVDVPTDRIVVTPGSSPALLLACLAVLDPGDETLLTDPHYAPYPNFVRQAEGRVRRVRLDVDDGFAPRLDRFAAALETSPAATLLNSPANPTGTVIGGDALRELVELADASGSTVISDEIYHGLDFDAEARSVLEFTDDAFVTDGFSKRFGMTGWRLGWAVVPDAYVDAVTRLAQNLVICAPSFVQDAGVAALRGSTEHLTAVRETYRRRRDVLVEAVESWGLDLGYVPGGAYYLLVDVSGLPGDALDAAELALEEAGVALTPGGDFGPAAADYLRVSYANTTARIREADARMRELLDAYGVR